jgi:hypothetical protein
MQKSTFALVSFVLVLAFGIAGCKPLNGKDTYSTCFAASDCANLSDSCVLVMSTSSDRMCTHSCTTGTDCPSSRDGDPYGVCLSVASGDTVCYSHCQFDSDCPSGWMCNLGTTRGAACTPR